jgi:hypothetical protein
MRQNWSNGSSERDSQSHQGGTKYQAACGRFAPIEFIAEKVMGTELPRRWPACKNCKGCPFQVAICHSEKTQSMKSNQQAAPE